MAKVEELITLNNITQINNFFHFLLPVLNFPELSLDLLMKLRNLLPKQPQELEP